MRKRHLKQAREWEAERDVLARFSSEILKERLIFSVPLQKLYEKVFFDRFDLIAACKPHDNYGDETIS